MIAIQIVSMSIGYCGDAMLPWCPHGRSKSLWSRLSFSWIDPLIKAMKRPSVKFTVDDLPSLESVSCAGELRDAFRVAQSQLQKQCLRGLIWRAHRRTIGALIGLSMASSLSAFSVRLVFVRVLRALETRSHSKHGSIDPLLWILHLGLGLTAVRLFTSWTSWSSTILLTRVQTQIRVAVFEKTMRLPAGHAVNKKQRGKRLPKREAAVPTALDARRVATAVADSYHLCNIPLRVIMATFLIVRLLGWRPTVSGAVAAVLTTFPAHKFAVRRFMRAQDTARTARKQRSTRLTNLLKSLRDLKLLALEFGYEEDVQRLRDSEIHALRNAAFWKGVVMTSISYMQPIIAFSVMMCVYVACYNELPGSTAFAATNILEWLEHSLLHIPQLLSTISDAHASASHIERYLKRPEFLPYVVSSEIVQFEEATIAWPNWDSESAQSLAIDRFTLGCVDLTLPRSSLTLVSGPSGSGKSLLLAAIVGEAQLLEGVVKAPHSLGGRVANVAQTPWIDKKTMRENILFGHSYNAQRYHDVLFACALEPDIQALERADLTMISDNVLSGGQKARIALARAIYSPADTLIIDDVLSALDAHTARHVYNNALVGKLANGRTRILASYHTELCLSHAHYAVILDGKGSCCGLPAGEFSRSITPTLYKASIVESTKPRNECPDNIKDFPRSFENSRSSSCRRPVGWHTLREFLTRCTSVRKWIFLAALVGVYAIFNIGRGYVIRDSTHRGEASLPIRYIGISMAAVAAGALQSYITINLILHGAHSLFHDSLRAVVRAHRRWLDITPLGTILARFTSDSVAVDTRIGKHIQGILFHSTGVAAILLASLLVSYRISLFPLVMLGLCFQYMSDYRAAVQITTRLESDSASSIIDHFASVMTGASTIRAFDMMDRYKKELFAKVDAHSRAFLHLWRLHRWISFRINMVCAALNIATAIFLVYQASTSSTVGFILTITMKLAGQFASLIRKLSGMEIDIHSIDRLVELTDASSEPDTPCPADLPQDWPTEGHVEAKGISARYREDLPPVLNDVSFAVKASSRIGIVGRTGAGKSSLILVLARFLDLEKGSIIVDDVNIAQVPAHELRRRIAFFPQNSLLTFGTVRTNLDPESCHTDADLLAALDKVHWRIRTHSHLNDTNNDGDDDISSENRANFLNHPITEGGTNISHGERQLLTLARAIVMQPKILVLDEPTSSVDKMTDNLIQQTLRTGFARPPTVIMIAHRLQSVMGLDYVLLLDKGKLVEYGAPETLMSRNGRFRAMVDVDLESDVV